MTSHLTTDDLEGRYRRAREPHERSWWQILWLLSRGQTAKAVAQSTGYSAYWIGQLAQRYNEQGPDAMVNRQHTRVRQPPTLLSSAQLEELRQALAGPAPAGRAVERAGGRRVDGGAPGPAGELPDGLDLPAAAAGAPTLAAPARPRHVAASPAEQEAARGGSASSAGT